MLGQRASDGGLEGESDGLKLGGGEIVAEAKGSDPAKRTPQPDGKKTIPWQKDPDKAFGRRDIASARLLGQQPRSFYTPSQQRGSHASVNGGQKAGPLLRRGSPNNGSKENSGAVQGSISGLVGFQEGQARAAGKVESKQGLGEKEGTGTARVLERGGRSVLRQLDGSKGPDPRVIGRKRLSAVGPGREKTSAEGASGGEVVHTRPEAAETSSAAGKVRGLPKRVPKLLTDPQRREAEHALGRGNGAQGGTASAEKGRPRADEEKSERGERKVGFVGVKRTAGQDAQKADETRSVAKAGGLRKRNAGSTELAPGSLKGASAAGRAAAPVKSGRAASADANSNRKAPTEANLERAGKHGVKDTAHLKRVHSALALKKSSSASNLGRSSGVTAWKPGGLGVRKATEVQKVRPEIGSHRAAHSRLVRRPSHELETIIAPVSRLLRKLARNLSERASESGATFICLDEWEHDTWQGDACGACRLPLLEPSPLSRRHNDGENDPSPEEVSMHSIMVCGHLYHSECLESVVLEIGTSNPSCPKCLLHDRLESTRGRMCAY